MDNRMMSYTRVILCVMLIRYLNLSAVLVAEDISA